MTGITRGKGGNWTKVCCLILPKMMKCHEGWYAGKDRRWGFIPNYLCRFSL